MATVTYYDVKIYEEVTSQNARYILAQKVSSTLRTSRAVTHPSTIRALHGLTSEFRWDPVHSMQYGR